VRPCSASLLATLLSSLHSPLPNILPSLQPTLSRRTSGQCLGPVTAVNLSLFPTLNAVSLTTARRCLICHILFVRLQRVWDCLVHLHWNQGKGAFYFWDGLHVTQAMCCSLYSVLISTRLSARDKEVSVVLREEGGEQTRICLCAAVRPGSDYSLVLSSRCLRPDLATF
jgi:hypothetical protein